MSLLGTTSLRYVLSTTMYSSLLRSLYYVPSAASTAIYYSLLHSLYYVLCAIMYSLLLCVLLQRSFYYVLAATFPSLPLGVPFSYKVSTRCTFPLHSLYYVLFSTR
jgi:hypothetical protein